MIRMQLPPNELDIQNGAVYAKVTLQPGIKFGLSGIKWAENPVDKNVAWPVSICFIYWKLKNPNQDYNSIERKENRVTKVNYIIRV